MSIIKGYKEYYDYQWTSLEGVSPLERERISQTIALIPRDCSSVLDVGCGSGWITNRLLSRYSRVVGLDLSIVALQHVKSEKIVGTIESLPFRDKSFDLVICSELLEHIPFQVYSKAVSKLERVVAKYIIVTVPFTLGSMFDLLTRKE